MFHSSFLCGNQNLFMQKESGKGGEGALLDIAFFLYCRWNTEIKTKELPLQKKADKNKFFFSLHPWP